MVLTSLPEPTTQIDMTGEVRRSRRAVLRDPLLAAIATMAISALGMTRPSLWYDEAATISAATRPLSELWSMLHNIDGVHGLYYLLMHGWLAIGPAHSFSLTFFLRLSSIVAIGIAAAGVVVLGKQLSSRTVALTAAAIFAVLPRVTWAAIEARSYALSMAAAVWLTVLCVSAIRREEPVRWRWYGVAAFGATVLHMYVLLILPAHYVLTRHLSGRRTAVRQWATMSAVAVGALLPFLWFGRSQMRQVGWIPPLRLRNIGEVFVDQYFDHSAAVAVLAGALIVVTVLLARRNPALIGTGDRLVMRVAAVWMLFPTATLLLYSALIKPMYWPRYVCFSTPAMALLLAVCLVAIARSRTQIIAAVVLLTVAAAPNFVVGQRGPYAKEHMDFTQVARVIEQHAAAGDCLILDNTIRWVPGPVRAITAAHPDVYAKLVDPGRGRRAVDRNMLWDGHLGIWSWKGRMAQCTTIWTVSDRDPTRPDHEAGDGVQAGKTLSRRPAYQVPASLGFRVVERWQFSFAQVVKSAR